MMLGLLIVFALGAILFLARRASGDSRIVMPTPVGAISDDPIEAAILSGRKIEAIKLFRERHSVGLKEAKHAVEDMERGLATS